MLFPTRVNLISIPRKSYRKVFLLNLTFCFGIVLALPYDSHASSSTLCPDINGMTGFSSTISGSGSASFSHEAYSNALENAEKNCEASVVYPVGDYCDRRCGIDPMCKVGSQTLSGEPGGGTCYETGYEGGIFYAICLITCNQKIHCDCVFDPGFIWDLLPDPTNWIPGSITGSTGSGIIGPNAN